MEGRMTICNMSIEAGARAGMVAPDDTTFAYLEGRPCAPTGAAWERALDGWRALPTDAGARSTARSRSTSPALEPQVTWGTNPGMVVAGRRRRARSGGARRRRRRAPPPSGRSRTWRSSRARRSRRSSSTASSSARARTRGSRTCAPRRAVVRGRRVHPTVRALVVPGLGAGEGAGRGGGARPGLRGRRLRVAARRLLDVPRHEPRHPRAGRALRLDLEPQLRGPAGRRRAHASRQPGDGRRGGDRRPLRRRAGSRR